MVDKVVCLNRNLLPIIPTSGVIFQCKSWIFREETLYLLLIVIFLFKFDFGIGRTAHNAIASFILLLIVTWDEYSCHVSRYSWYLKKDKKVLKKPKRNLELLRQGLITNQCSWHISRIRLLTGNESFFDFTEFSVPPYDAAKNRVVFRIDLTHGLYGWHVWRSLNQIKALYSELNASYAPPKSSQSSQATKPGSASPKARPASGSFTPISRPASGNYELQVASANNSVASSPLTATVVPPLVLPDPPSSSMDETKKSDSSCDSGADAVMFSDDYVLQCQRAISIWFHSVMQSDVLSSDATFRHFLGMAPYEKDSQLLDEYASIGNPMSVPRVAGDDSLTKYDKGRFWSGNTIEDVCFLDETDEMKSQYLDCSYNHNFKVRGLTYKADKRKIDAGSPICKMIMLEMFEAVPSDGGRIDHIAERGVVKERIRVLNSLEGNPFVLLLNIQIPGDPPVSIVSYFVVPPDLEQKMSSPSDKKFLGLLQQFLDMPRTEEARLAAWGVSFTDASAAATTLEPTAGATTAPVKVASPAGSLRSSDGAEVDGGDGDIDSVESDSGDNGTDLNAKSNAADVGAVEDVGHYDEKQAKDKTSLATLRRGFGGLGNSMRRLMATKKSSQDKDDDMSKSHNGRDSDGIQIARESSADANEEGDGAVRRKSLFSRSMMKLPSIRGFGKKNEQNEDDTASHEDEVVNEEGETLKRVSHFQRNEKPPLFSPAAKSVSSATASVTKTKPSIKRAPQDPDAMSHTSSHHSKHSQDAKEGTVSGRGESLTGTESVTGTDTGGLRTASFRKPSSNPKGPMGLPSDIQWPSPEEPGALPSDDFRNARFKLIPIITDGPWVVKMAVRSTPVLLGQKVVQRYFRGDRYLEIDVHVGSSIIAAQIVGVCRSYTKSYCTNLGIVIQGEDEDELPERLLACITFNKLDVDRVRSKL